MFENQVVLITGGTRGIGFAVARKFSENGASVILNYANNEEAAKNAISKLQRNNGDAEIFQANVANEKEVEKMINNIKQNHNKIDILVNNAGVFTEDYIYNMTQEKWFQTLDVNLTGVFNCTKHASRIMIKRNFGRIINISSMVAEKGSNKHAHYAATKGGLLSFTYSIAKELAQYGITANAVSPGRIKTDMIKDNIEENMERWMAETPIKRLGKPEEVAEAVYFLASEAASYITGEVFHVDGGLLNS